MSSSQNLIQKMSDMSLTDDNKTRHESKLLYRMDHLSLSSTRAVKQTNLPSTFSPTPFDHSWKDKLPATGTRVSDSKHKRPEGDLKDPDVDMIVAAPSDTKAAVRSDPNQSKNTEHFDQGNITSALASNPEPNECFECGKWFLEKDNGPNACVFHWGVLIAKPYQRNPTRGRRRVRRRRTPLSGRVWVWDCCDRGSESKGCYVRRHVANLLS